MSDEMKNNPEENLQEEDLNALTEGDVPTGNPAPLGEIGHVSQLLARIVNAGQLTEVVTQDGIMERVEARFLG